MVCRRSKISQFSAKSWEDTCMHQKLSLQGEAFQTLHKTPSNSTQSIITGQQKWKSSHYPAGQRRLKARSLALPPLAPLLEIIGVRNSVWGSYGFRVYGEQEIESTFRRRWRSSESRKFLSFPLSSPLPMRLRIVIFILFRESGKRRR